MGERQAVSIVTGAAGFVGQALVRRLLADGDRVRAVVLPGDPCTEELRALGSGTDRLEVVAADITDAASIAPVFVAATRAFHTAALVHAWAPWEKFRAVNVGGTRNVAEAALKHGVRLVAVSTTDVFGVPASEEPIDERSPRRRWNEPYPDTKIEAEQWLWEFAGRTGLPVSVIYPGWVYGPGDKAFFPSLAKAIDDGMMVQWCRDVRLRWVYIDNLADACVLAGTHPAAVGNGYIVHDDSPGPTFEEACASIAAAVGKRASRLHVPYGVMLAAAAAVQTIWRLLRLRGIPPLLTVDVKAFGSPRWPLSSAKIRRELGWAPGVGIEAGMQAALRYLVERRAAAGS